MNRIPGLILLVIFLGAGCSSTGQWNHTKLTELPVTGTVPGAESCKNCHMKDYASWKTTDHADRTAMEKISVVQFRECGACHDNLEAHLASPKQNMPKSITALDKSDQNRICGTCHFDKDLLGRKAINPHHDHALFTSAGFEGKEHQLSCLDCHKGHSGKRNMLRGMQAHTCFTCHKSAIVTMGVFQPFNYLAAGKVCSSCHALHGTSKAGHAARMSVGAVAVCMPCHMP